MVGGGWCTVRTVVVRAQQSQSQASATGVVLHRIYCVVARCQKKAPLTVSLRLQFAPDRRHQSCATHGQPLGQQKC